MNRLEYITTGAYKDVTLYEEILIQNLLHQDRQGIKFI